MEVMTVAETNRRGSPMVARHALARKRPWPQKGARRFKSARGHNGTRDFGGGQLEGGFDGGICLARQAGPGPRI
jgi:hypothetical protein